MRFLVFFLLFLLSASSFAANVDRCARSRSSSAEEIVRIGRDVWAVNAGTKLFILSNDHVQKIIEHSDPFLVLTCSPDARLVAFSGGKSIYLFDGERLVPTPMLFPGGVLFTDGVSVYSVDYPNNGKDGERYYATSSGITKELTDAALSPGFERGGYFQRTVKGGYVLYKDGEFVRRVRNPAFFHPGLGMGYSDYSMCGTDGLFAGLKEYEYWLRSKFGVAKFINKDGIRKLDFTKGCAEYILLPDHDEISVGQLQRLVPGKKLSRSVLPTACSVDSFSMNLDGSIYYRCDSKFYFKPAYKGEDVFLGEIKASFGGRGTDTWFPTDDIGTLYGYITAKSEGEPQSACFARLLPERLIDSGCVEISAIKP